jgi:hypothetical protein
VKPGKRLWTGQPQVKPFKVELVPEGGGPARDVSGRLAVKPVIGSPRRVMAGLGALIAAIAGILAVLFVQCGDGDEALVVVPTPTPVPPEVIEKEEDNDVHLCAPDEGGPPPAPADGFVRVKPAILAALSGDGIDVTAPLFAQNDARWGGEEYARAADDQFRAQNLCGSTISQCGCAMTSVATVMSLFQLATMPDGQALTPEQLNSWMNIGATRTARGWVSQGYIYGDVIWAAANQLSAEMAKARPGTPTMRFRAIGSGSEEQIRAELQAGRPIILEVPGHWIAAIGIDPQTNRISSTTLLRRPHHARRVCREGEEQRHVRGQQRPQRPRGDCPQRPPRAHHRPAGPRRRHVRPGHPCRGGAEGHPRHPRRLVRVQALLARPELHQPLARPR